MDARDKRRVGEQVEPAGRPKAPGRLELLQRFINSYNHEFPRDWDRLGTPEKAYAWLHRKGLLDAGDPVSTRHAARLRELREAMRAQVVAHHAGRSDAASTDIIRAAARSARLRVAIDDSGRTRLAAAGGGVSGAVATLLGIMHEAQISGQWSRLKGCRQCGYAFFDRSRNRSAVWCAMSICGNRAKNRTYYRRDRASTS
jgi:predicted RNA-binding Zn ribbon-like protein